MSYAQPSVQSYTGWNQQDDGWFYWWSNNQCYGAWHPTRKVWQPYDPMTGWGKETSRPPWKK